MLYKILVETETVKNVNKNNALHAVLFEAVLLVTQLDLSRKLLMQCCTILGRFITMREPNIRYLGLENMTGLATVPDMLDSIKKFQPQIVASLHDPDISIRKRALDLLYNMCDATNARDIVNELLQCVCCLTSLK